MLLHVQYIVLPELADGLVVKQTYESNKPLIIYICGVIIVL